MGNRESKQAKQPAAVTAAAAATRDEPSNAPRAAPLGEWESPVSSASIAEKAVKLSNPTLRPSDGALFWVEMRPSEAGRQVLVMRSPDGTIRDVTPPAASPADAFNVRTTVYEYGGGEYCIVGETAYFTNFKDQALYAQELGGAEPSPPRLVTHGSVDRGERFADASWDEARRRLVVVSEFHKDPQSGSELPPEKVVNRLVAVDAASGDVAPLVTGSDFYGYPSVSPNGRWLAWVQWDFPNMPWDHTSLFVAPLLDDGTVGQSTKIAGEGSSVQQPTWSPDGSYLYFVDDESDWWNLYRCRTPVTTGGTDGTAGWTAAGGTADAEPLSPMEAEWGFPAWNLDRRSYQVLDDGSVLGVFTDPRVAGHTLALLQPPTNGGGGVWKLSRINAGMTHYSSRPFVRQTSGGGGGPSGSAASGGGGDGGSLTVAAVAASFTCSTSVVQLTAASLDALAAATAADWQVVKSASMTEIPEGYISVPEAVEFPTTFNGKPTTAHMLYYPPTNKDFTYPPGTLPPLLVKGHGGPTGCAVPALSALLQYWTSRGFAVADIDYGGSTGYGTAYRNRLNGRWGEVDVQDCAAAAEWLVSAGRVDPNRLCISGGSAGGFTTLACLTFRKTFSAGASLYGVTDPKLLAEHTHKFESRYMDMMIGPLPDAAEVYDARSPLKHAANFSSPVIFFQGDQDKVVPPEQAVAMYNAIKAAGLPTGLVMFPGEQHGFRQATSIRTALEGEVYFYGAVLGFKAVMSEDLPKITIDNLPQPPQPSQQQQQQQQEQ